MGFTPNAVTIVSYHIKFVAGDPGQALNGKSANKLYDQKSIHPYIARANVAATMKFFLTRIAGLLVLIIILYHDLPAQQILFRNYSVTDGLCSNTVWSISQDHQGYMWFGTKNGLNRFDGYAFTSYQFHSGQSQVIGNNFIHTTCAYDTSHYLVGTEDGIFLLNLETEQFSKFGTAAHAVVYDIIRDRKGVVWIATRTDGLFSHDPRTGENRQYLPEPGNKNSLSLNQVRKLAEDDKGQIWIGTFGEGIDVLDPVTSTFSHHKSTAKTGDNINKIITLYKDLRGNMWSGSLGGLTAWDTRTDSSQVYVNGGSGTINDNIVRAIYQPSADILYAGTEKGLNVLNLKTGMFSSYTHKSNDPHSISDNAVYSIYPDREGGIWLGTFFGGVNYFPQKGADFELYYATGETSSLSGNAVSCFLEDKPGYFWIGTENAGLNYFDVSRKTFKQYPFSPEQQSLSYHNIHCLLKDDRGQLWIGTFSGGLNIYNPATGRVKKYLHNPLDSTTISNNNIYAVYKDKDGVIWVGTTEGLNIYDPETDSFHRVQEMGMQNSLIYNMYEDDHRNIWFITYDRGLVAKNKTTGEWVNYRFRPGGKGPSSNKIISMLDDGHGNLWLGTDGAGLNRFNMAAKTFTVFDERQGISTIVFGILEDGSDHLWLSTNDGIIKFSLRTYQSRLFTNLDNLQSKQFNYNAAAMSADGKLYFGGINGFNAFYPANVRDVALTNQITLTNFQLFNKDVRVGVKEGLLNKNIGFIKSLVLDASQTVISFEYAAMSYLAPEKIRYAYLMEGFDKTWNYVGGQRKATYTNLPAGKYVFRVKATDIYGNWNEQPVSLPLVIRPPFYRSTVAYLLYALVIASAILLLRRFLMLQARKKNEVKLERLKNQREHEFYNEKLDFFTTMAHEIRTPLSLIIAPLEKLLGSNDWQPIVKEQLGIMDENADRLLNLVNQLLDFRRIESDIYKIQPEQVEMVSFMHALYARFSSIAEQKGIAFSMTTTVSRLMVQADPEAMTKILTNLVINAFKFTKSVVDLRLHDAVSSAGGPLYFSVSVMDDGPGVPASDRENIFKAFYKVTSDAHQAKNLGGTGIGLALAKSLTEKHQGQLLVESKEGVETIFTVRLPCQVPATATATADLLQEVKAGDAEPAANDKPVILLVEDDASMRQFLTQNLEAEHYTIIAAANGMDGLQLLETNAVELILSDVMMPGMDGTEFCRRVKQDMNYSHIPFIILTAKANSDAEIAGIESGADAYIMKPFKWKHVTVVIKNLLDSRLLLKNKFARQPFAPAQTLTTNTPDKKFIDQLIGVIEERITDPQLSVEELSREMAMSRSSLHKKLKAMSGHVPNEFIRLIRLKNAAKMLLNNRHTISEVGYLNGFNSPSYFSKCFMQQFGVTPSEFAENERKVVEPPRHS